MLKCFEYWMCGKSKGERRALGDARRTVSNSLIKKCLGLGGLPFPERILRIRSVSCLPFCPGAPPWVNINPLWRCLNPTSRKGDTIQLAGSTSSSMSPWDTVHCCCWWNTVHYSITNFQDKAGMGSCHLTLMVEPPKETVNNEKELEFLIYTCQEFGN